MGFREQAEKILTAEEMPYLKTAFDMIGDIAIIEVDDRLRKKERRIAKILLWEQKNIKTVLRKDSGHEGEYRTQRYKFLAGVDKRETVHLENGCRLKLDVEKVYFSPRMGNERYRIAAQVKDGERVLVLFSGCGPYPITIGKNTKAEQVVAVELNPSGHRYAVENILLNKLDNVVLLQGDARSVVESFFNRQIGLKSYWVEKELKQRLRMKPSLMELHLNPADLDEHLPALEKVVSSMRRKGITVVLHAPFTYHGQDLDISGGRLTAEMKRLTSMLESLCAKHDLLGYVMHPYHSKDAAGKTVKSLYRNLTKHMMVENVMAGFSTDTGALLDIGLRQRLCIDLAHLAHASSEPFYQALQALATHDPYFHIADSPGADSNGFHTRPIGEGVLDFSRIIPFINQGVIEVHSKDEAKPREMLVSYKRLNKMIDKWPFFDRIVMPMPKGGSDFLDIALRVAKKGSMIHFYDFLHENDFALAEKKVAKACRKAKVNYKALGLFKCGQHSPRTFRVCLDFRVLGKASHSK